PGLQPLVDDRADQRWICMLPMTKAVQCAFPTSVMIDLQGCGHDRQTFAVGLLLLWFLRLAVERAYVPQHVTNPVNRIVQTLTQVAQALRAQCPKASFIQRNQRLNCSLAKQPWN